jgi:excisionase family DNA binding protein
MSMNTDVDGSLANRPAVTKRTARGSLVVARVVEPILPQSSPTVALRGLEAAFLAFLQSKVSSSVVPIEHRLFLNLAECSEFSGLPVAFLKRLIASRKLKALKTGSGWRISRAELEKVSALLSDPPEELSEHEIRDMELVRQRRRGFQSPAPSSD